MTTRHLYIFLIFFGHNSFAQDVEIVERGRYDADTEQKLAMISDTLIGNWLLKNNLCLGVEKNDTLSQKVYNISKSSPAVSRPKIIFSFRQGGELVITEFPIASKIIVAWGQWHVLVRSRDDIAPFYLYLYITRYSGIDFSKFKGFTTEFNGFITEFDINSFQLKDTKKLDGNTQWKFLNFVRL